MTFDGKRLRELRTAKGLSIQQLADKLKVDKASVSLWECGKYTPRLRRIRALARIFGVRESEFLKEESNAAIQAKRG